MELLIVMVFSALSLAAWLGVIVGIDYIFCKRGLMKFLWCVLFISAWLAILVLYKKSFGRILLLSGNQVVWFKSVNLKKIKKRVFLF